MAVAGGVDDDVEAPEVPVRGRDRGEVELAVPTSSSIGSAASPYSLLISWSSSARRAATATRSPRSSAATAHSRPSPLDAPVMNHVFTNQD